ncbi:MAG: argininosuccinate synthase [Lewinellaceae bacterium]|nr:argininosuccinate synthase [Lewinella sp.]MCB9282005.1 argininosuccinate synthase [Lewinellaceae bacterium]
MPNKKVALAYSGGLDTSFCIKYLTLEEGCEVHAISVNTGGFTPEALAAMEKKAYELGAASFHSVDAVRSYYDQCLRYLVYGNVLRNNTYPLSVSAERMFQALEVARFARSIGADAIAHGSTGAGNDQVRFDLAFQVICPDTEIITPIRDHRFAREEEVDYLRKHGFEWTAQKAKYSINQGIWGTSVGGAETLTSHQALPDGAYPTPLSQTEPLTVTLGFQKGELAAVDGKQFAHPVEAIQALDQLAAPFAVGRDIHVGDTIIGIKGRVGFEAAAPLIIIKAHHLLEKHVLVKWQQYWKEQLANWYGMMLHESLFLDPVMRNIEAFLTSTQEFVTGEVIVKLLPYRFELQGIQSPYDLMQTKAGQYGEMNNNWSGEDVKGFTKILGNQLKIYQSVHPEWDGLS